MIVAAVTSYGAESTPAERTESIDAIAWTVHRKGAYASACLFEAAMVQTMRDDRGQLALRIEAKPTHRSSRRFLIVIVTPRALEQLGTNLTTAVEKFAGRSVRVRGKFFPAPTKVWGMPDGVDYYTARVDVSDASQLAFGERQEKRSPK